MPGTETDSLESTVNARNTDAETGAIDNQDDGEVLGGQPETQPQKPSEVDELASEMGWAPKDQWRGDPDKWVDARTFIRNERRINESLKGRITALETGVKQLNKYNSVIVDKQVAKRLKEIEAEREDAIRDGDIDAVKKLDKELRDFEKEAESLKSGGDDDGEQDSPIVADWKKNNPWYGVDAEKTLEANGFAFALRQQDYTGQALLNELDRRMSKLYPPEKGMSANKEIAVNTEQNTSTATTTATETKGTQRQNPTVEGGGNKPSNQGRAPKHTINDLLPEFKKVATEMVRSGAFKTEQEYIDALAEDSPEMFVR